MFVDWLTVRQGHRQAPLFADSYVARVDIEDGKLIWGNYVGKSEEGSFSSSLRIRSDGRMVEVSGNPSRWNREENLFGVRSVDAAIAVFNSVLVGLGLPEFYEDERTRLSARLLQGSDSLARDGCTITRVDVTENYSTGGLRNSEHALHALRAFRHQNRAPVDYGSSLYWGMGSNFTTRKYYLKGPEMRRHRKGKSEYWDQVLAFVEAEGVLRFEVSCKSAFLRRSGLDRPGAWSDEVMSAILKGYGLHERATAGASSMNDIRGALVSAGIGELRATRLEHGALAFLNGCNMRDGMSKSTFYRMRRDLLLVGIDIAADLNISALRFAIETIQLKPTEMPDWYRKAS
jgi:hypothetical protein